MKHKFILKSLVSCLTAIVLFLFACKKNKSDTPAPPPPVPPLTTKKITAFEFKQADNTVYLDKDIMGTVGADTITVVVPAETDINHLKPLIAHNGKTISPAVNAVQNFSSPVQYIVTAEDGTAKNYIVSVKYRPTAFI